MLYLVDREKQILSTVRRATRQGFSAEQQYDALNQARARRKKRAERNQQTIMSGGYKQIPIIKCP